MAIIITPEDITAPGLTPEQVQKKIDSAMRLLKKEVPCLDSLEGYDAEIAKDYIVAGLDEVVKATYGQASRKIGPFDVQFAYSETSRGWDPLFPHSYLLKLSRLCGKSSRFKVLVLENRVTFDEWDDSRFWRPLDELEY